MRRINNKQDLANRITESVLKEMGLKHSSRRKALKENREQEILDKVHSMRSNIFDMTEEGYGVLYIDYDPQTNELYAGGATNAGIIKEYSVDYDDSQSLDYNLEGLYDEILQSPPTDDTMAENKKRIRKIVAESLKKHLREDEERYMSDEDIASQYDGMKITYFEMKPCRYSEGWKGTFELEFPNADEIDYDSTMVNDFITYDKEGSRIGWDNWMPDAQIEQLENIIRKEIAKRSSQTR